ncbi:hypothetical protein MBM_04595 [Drepanopeziza brunnea f. sp. 'multigermtubi' MB_m1]|uniref:Uncharacterized protein n=1 Tax=Marssonina brunnea f. sp. multigermtubi (strain MB_m1) TaxID=1072389 RepID=K1X8J8_MARBU|nr:uncharacterized protein MBM_04595 [Drepanopeziza brunnea f. sp. 'multigermtubi' MB_m1]EKD17018.1 hypothetical protein MBM_04595 [Drepanopeziza brunnea f. sp. 'multigermtubi' MB_m1]
MESSTGHKSQPSSYGFWALDLIENIENTDGTKVMINLITSTIFFSERPSASPPSPLWASSPSRTSRHARLPQAHGILPIPLPGAFCWRSLTSKLAPLDTALAQSALDAGNSVDGILPAATGRLHGDSSRAASLYLLRSPMVAADVPSLGHPAHLCKLLVGNRSVWWF